MEDSSTTGTTQFGSNYREQTRSCPETRAGLSEAGPDRLAMTESVAVRSAIRLAPPPGGFGGRVAPADRCARAYERHLCPTCERDYGLVSSSGRGRLFGAITVIWT